MKKFSCVGIGELLWDMLPGGKQLGGAPANFAYHASKLGGSGNVISRVGNDALGFEILNYISDELDLQIETIQRDMAAQTSTVSVELAEDKSAKYTIHEYVAWDFIEATERARATAAEAGAICFGSLAQRLKFSRIAIRQLLDVASRDCLRIFDINLRQNFYSKEVIDQSLARASILKINDQELPVLAAMFALSGEPREQLQQIIERYDLRGAAYTRGADGSALLIDGQWSDLPGVPTTVVDTIGAGDSFTAAMTIGLLRGWPIEQIHERASRVAAYVCSQPGATPKMPSMLTSLFR